MTEQKKTLTIVDKSTKAMNTAATALQKTIADLNGVAAIAEGLAQDIEFKQAELDGLSSHFKEQERKEKAELALRILENEDLELGKILKKRGLASITTADLNTIRAELDAVTRESEEKVQKAVAAAVRNAEAKYKSDLTELKAAHSVETATLKADKSALEGKVNNLEDTIENLRSMLESEREARVEIARNSATPTINVSSAK